MECINNKIYELRITTEDTEYSDGYYLSLNNAINFILDNAIYIDHKYYSYYVSSYNGISRYDLYSDKNKYKANSLNQIKNLLIDSCVIKPGVIGFNNVGVTCKRGVYWIRTHDLLDAIEMNNKNKE